MTRPTGSLRPFLSHILELRSVSGEGDQPKTSWIQLFTTGDWWDERYGDFSLTRADLAQMLANFRDVTPKAPTKLPVDYNHGTSKPTTAEAGKAAGWIRALDLRAAGDELWGEVEWTGPAADMIAAKEYQFVSPTFAYDYKHSNGQAIGTTLLAAAITNRPVLEGMAPLSLSHPAARVRTPQEIDMAKDLITVKDANGNDVKLSAETVAALKGTSADTTLTQKVLDLSTVVETLKGTVEAVKGENVELKKQNDALVLAQKTDAATAKVDTLIQAGKVLPVERDGLIKLALSNADLFDEATKHRPVAVQLNTEIGTSTSGDATVNGQIEAAITETQKANPKLSREQAMTQALAKNPKLYDLAQKQ